MNESGGRRPVNRWWQNLPYNRYEKTGGSGINRHDWWYRSLKPQRLAEIDTAGIVCDCLLGFSFRIG